MVPGPASQGLRRQALGNSVASNPFYFVRRRFQKLYSDFKPNMKYWRLLLLIRKLCLAFTTVLFIKWPIFQGAVSLAVMFGAYVIHAACMPYMHRENVPLTFYDIVNRDMIGNKEVRAVC